LGRDRARIRWWQHSGVRACANWESETREAGPIRRSDVPNDDGGSVALAKGSFYGEFCAIVRCRFASVKLPRIPSTGDLKLLRIHQPWKRFYRNSRFVEAHIRAP